MDLEYNDSKIGTTNNNTFLYSTFFGTTNILYMEKENLKTLDDYRKNTYVKLWRDSGETGVYEIARSMTVPTAKVTKIVYSYCDLLIRECKKTMRPEIRNKKFRSRDDYQSFFGLTDREASWVYEEMFREIINKLEKQ